MAKRKPPARPAPLSPLAERLLQAMAARPGRVEYNIRVLPGVFRDGDTQRLDDAYAELLRRGLAEQAAAEISFFGRWKRLCRLTALGMARAQREAA